MRTVRLDYSSQCNLCVSVCIYCATQLSRSSSSSVGHVRQQVGLTNWLTWVWTIMYQSLRFKCMVSCCFRDRCMCLKTLVYGMSRVQILTKVTIIIHIHVGWLMVITVLCMIIGWHWSPLSTITAPIWDLQTDKEDIEWVSLPSCIIYDTILFDYACYA